tara:strand:+ start:107 stop:502 length:396 start_codon:yes stop_codon:yes gene_type:complete
MIKDILSAVSGVASEFIEDKDKKNELETRIQEKLISLDLAQAQANIQQAKHSSVFVAGARPAIMWVACLGLLTNFFLMPLAEWATAIWWPGTPLPKLQTEELMTLTLSVLGLGGMRSWEKSKGVARNKLKE